MREFNTGSRNGAISAAIGRCRSRAVDSRLRTKLSRVRDWSAAHGYLRWLRDAPAGNYGEARQKTHEAAWASHSRKGERSRQTPCSWRRGGHRSAANVDRRREHEERIHA
jgi:hypothetical protein